MSDIDSSTCNCSKSISESLLSHSMLFVLNAFLHVSILYTFLYLLYTFVIKDLETNAFKAELSDIIDNNINSNLPSLIDLEKYKSDYNYKIAMLNNLNSSFGLSSNPNVLLQENSDEITKITNILNSLTVPNILDNYIKEYSKPNYVINLHNENILEYGIRIIAILSFIAVFLIAVVKFSCGMCTNVTKLFIENILTFVFVGGIEYWFFMTYASKFVPAPPSLLMTTAINSIKANLSS